MAARISRRSASQARLTNATPSKKACDVCDAVTSSSTSTYPASGVETLVTSGPASQHPHRMVEGGQHQADVDGCLDEREAMALEGGVSPAFARVFAALQVARPASVNLSRWHQAIEDVAIFLDTWGGAAERLGWTARDVIGPHFTPAALAWFLNGAQVISLTPTRARLSDGRTFVRTAGAETNATSARLERGSVSIARQYQKA